MRLEISADTSPLTTGGLPRFLVATGVGGLGSDAYTNVLRFVASWNGFIAALDQSGGSTPKALKLYGVGEDAYSNEEEMFDRIHEMRTRIITSPAFDGDRLIGAILFENTMDREVEGIGTAEYLWAVKRVVPFLKVDKGLAADADGVQLMKPMPGLDGLLERAAKKGVFGTKMRSVIKRADEKGVAAIVTQQFKVGQQILAAGLVPILEPEVDIHSPDKAEAEALLRAGLLAGLEFIGDDQHVMFKVTLPEQDDFYRDLIEHSPVGQALFDRDGAVLHANQAYADLYGLSVDDLRGVRTLALAHPDERADAVIAYLERIADDVIPALQQYDWPGNVRELENVIERAVVLSSILIIITNVVLVRIIFFFYPSVTG